jgi:hypothetical protein
MKGEYAARQTSYLCTTDQRNDHTRSVSLFCASEHDYNLMKRNQNYDLSGRSDWRFNTELLTNGSGRKRSQAISRPSGD